jgi:hypothetical protein
MNMNTPQDRAATRDHWANLVTEQAARWGELEYSCTSEIDAMLAKENLLTTLIYAEYHKALTLFLDAAEGVLSNDAVYIIQHSAPTQDPHVKSTAYYKRQLAKLNDLVSPTPLHP